MGIIIVDKAITSFRAICSTHIVAEINGLLQRWLQREKEREQRIAVCDKLCATIRSHFYKTSSGTSTYISVCMRYVTACRMYGAYCSRCTIHHL